MSEGTATANPTIQRWFSGSSVGGHQVPLVGLVNEIERQKASKKDYVASSQNIKMIYRDGTEQGGVHLLVGGLNVPTGEESFAISPTCHKQIAEKCGIPQKYYDRMYAQKPGLLTQNVNTWLPDKDRRMVRTLDGRARALVSERFRTLDNADLFFAAAAVFRDVKAEIVRADLSDDHFYMKAIRPDLKATIKPGDELVGGVILSNSETGQGGLNIEQFSLRLKCMNGMVGETILSRAHLGEKMDVGVYQADTIQKSTEAIWLQARDHIRKAFAEPTLTKLAADLMGGVAVELPAMTEMVNGSWTNLGVTKEEKNAILTHLLGDGEGATQFGLAQAITATAQTLNDADRWVALERLGYRLGTASEPEFRREMVQAVKVSRAA